MNTPRPGELADLFDRLADLEPAARAAQMADLAPDLRAHIERLFAAEASAGDPLAEAIAGIGAAQPVDAGQRLGPWRILRELGAGGMGTVFLAERADGQYVQQAAIKVIRGFPTEDGRRRLRMERQILAGLDHPNIARLLDGGETADGQPYVAMEYVDGTGLLEYIATQRLDHAARLDLFDHIADAVQHAHQRLVIHRDIKPGNVLVRADGGPELLDFGVAKLVDLGVDTDRRNTSTRVWTPGYASPEQKLGKPVTTVTDVYSLGVMLREMLSGARDAGGNLAAPLPPTFTPVEIDAELRGVIAMATAEEPARRYASVEALREDLRRHRDGRPVRAAADTPIYRARKFIGRHRLGVSATVLVLAALAAFVWRLDAARNRALAAEAQARSAQREAEASRAETQRQLVRAGSAIDFIANVFGDAAPDRTGGKPIAVHDLVALGEKRLATAPPADAGVAADLATVLGELYLRLGEGDSALRLLQQGLAGQQATDAASAAELAKRNDTLAVALLDLERNDEALAVAEAGRDLRQRFLAEVPVAQARTAYSMALTLQAVRRYDEARTQIEQAVALMAQYPDQVDIEPIDMLSLAAAIANAQSRFDDALSLSDRALADEADIATRRPSLLIEAYRTRARALQGLGRLEDADRAFDVAIERHTTLIGDRGVRAMGLHNDHGVLLASLAHYREAIAAYQRSAAIFAAAGGPRPDDDTRYLNNLCDSYNGLGAYAQALEHCTRAVALMRERRPPEDIERTMVDSQNARTLAMLGRHAEAAAAFDDVIARASAALGADAFPVGIHTFRAARAALLAGDLPRAATMAARSQAIIDATFTSPHHWRGRIARVRGLLALAQGQLDDAQAAFDTAAEEFTRSLPAGHLLIAQVDADRAALAMARGDSAQARERLQAALPVMRKLTEAAEVERAAAERLARRLGIP